jgi:hypothetical protein
VRKNQKTDKKKIVENLLGYFRTFSAELCTFILEGTLEAYPADI